MTCRNLRTNGMAVLRETAGTGYEETNRPTNQYQHATSSLLLQRPGCIPRSDGLRRFRSWQDHLHGIHVKISSIRLILLPSNYYCLNTEFRNFAAQRVTQSFPVTPKSN